MLNFIFVVVWWWFALLVMERTRNRLSRRREGFIGFELVDLDSNHLNGVAFFCASGHPDESG
jgi:hypothetical protein